MTFNGGFINYIKCFNYHGVYNILHGGIISLGVISFGVISLGVILLGVIRVYTLYSKSKCVFT